MGASHSGHSKYPEILCLSEILILFTIYGAYKTTGKNFIEWIDIIYTPTDFASPQMNPDNHMAEAYVHSNGTLWSSLNEGFTRINLSPSAKGSNHVNIPNPEMFYNWDKILRRKTPPNGMIFQGSTRLPMEGPPKITNSKLSEKSPMFSSHQRIIQPHALISKRYIINNNYCSSHKQLKR